MRDLAKPWLKTTDRRPDCVHRTLTDDSLDNLTPFFFFCTSQLTAAHVFTCSPLNSAFVLVISGLCAVKFGIISQCMKSMSLSSDHVTAGFHQPFNLGAKLTVVFPHTRTHTHSHTLCALFASLTIHLFNCCCLPCVSFTMTAQRSDSNESFTASQFSV